MLAKRILPALAAALLILPSLLVLAADAPTIPATDQKTIQANLDKDVIISGTIADAKWSPKGNIIFLKFVGKNPGDFEAIAKKENRAALDQAFDGDIAKTLAKARVLISGKISKFKNKEAEESFQLEITAPSQIQKPPTTTQKS